MECSGVLRPLLCSEYFAVDRSTVQTARVDWRAGWSAVWWVDTGTSEANRRSVDWSAVWGVEAGAAESLRAAKRWGQGVRSVASESDFF